MELNKWHRGTELPDTTCNMKTFNCVIVYKGYFNATFYELGVCDYSIANDKYDFIDEKGRYIRSDKIVAYMPIEMPKELSND